MPENPFPPPDPGLDAAVRARLEADAARTDGAAMWANVRARLEGETARPRRRWFGPVAALVATAAALFLAVALWPANNDVAASPAEVVDAARKAHEDGPDRCYTVASELPPGLQDRYPLVAAAARSGVVCTRGDRFVVESAFGTAGVWGRDPDGRVWVAPTRDAAARYTRDEFPPPLRTVVAVWGLDLRTLLADVLADFDLARVGATADTDTITATRSGPSKVFQPLAAEITVEKATGTVRRLVLNRSLPNDHVAKITFELQSTGTRDPAMYTAEGHLRAGAPVYDSDRRVLRLRVLAQGLGEILAKGL
jgi:hypothetical protein